MTTSLPTTYQLALPNGWVRLAVRESDDAGVRAAVASVLPADLPRDDAAKARARIEGRLRVAIAQAREIDAVDLYVPLGGMGGFSIPASFLVTEIRTEQGERGVEAALTAIGGGAAARPVEIDGGPAVRTEQIESEPDPQTETPVRYRRISYLVPMAGTGRMLAITCSIVIGDDANADYVQALVALFDAVLRTFRWVYPVTE